MPLMNVRSKIVFVFIVKEFCPMVTGIQETLNMIKLDDHINSFTMKSHHFNIFLSFFFSFSLNSYVVYPPHYVAHILKTCQLMPLIKTNEIILIVETAPGFLFHEKKELTNIED